MRWDRSTKEKQRALDRLRGPSTVLVASTSGANPVFPPPTRLAQRGADPRSSLVTECATPRAAWIWCDDFEQDRMSRYFEYDSAGGRFVRAPGTGVGGSFGMRARWDSSGRVGAGALHLAMGRTPQAFFRPVDAGGAVYRDLYWRIFVEMPPGWRGGGAGKHTPGLHVFFGG